jgi:hypothetical protein
MLLLRLVLQLAVNTQQPLLCEHHRLLRTSAARKSMHDLTWGDEAAQAIRQLLLYSTTLVHIYSMLGYDSGY